MLQISAVFPRYPAVNLRNGMRTAEWSVNVENAITILSHTGVYYFEKGKLMLHLRYDFESSDDCDTTGKILRFYRLHKGYSTCELAEKAGVVPAMITLYENDKNPIKHKTAVLLAEALDIDRKLLLDDYGKFIDYPYNVRLRELRESLSLSQSQIADKIGVSQTAYFAWERAEKRHENKNIKRYSRLLKQPISIYKIIREEP